MATWEDFRAAALPLPGVRETTSMGEPCFKVGKKGLVHLWGWRALMKLDRGRQELLFEARPDVFAPFQAGAVDYLSKPADADDVAKALLAQAGESPAPPDNPMSADRVRWEHIQRVYELCSHNVSETARRLNMHRRTLQRILAKRAPR